MRIRNFHVSIFIIFIFLSIFLSIPQISNAIFIPIPRIKPITLPTTPSTPASPPIPSITRFPISPPGPKKENVVSGHITYRIWGLTVPAINVSVELTNLIDQWKLVALTDLLGQYSFNPPDGIYMIKVYDQRNTRFNPSSRLIKVQNKKYYNLDFQGLLLIKL